MNWRDRIILGAIAGSGMFKFKNLHYEVFEAHGFSRNKDKMLIALTLDEIQEDYVDVRFLKLQARHISSMTEEEFKFAKKNYGWEKDEKHEFIQACKEDKEMPSSLLFYLLSIGILPDFLANDSVEYITQMEGV